MKTTLIKNIKFHNLHHSLINLAIVFLLIQGLLFSHNLTSVQAADLLQANFDSGQNGFSYIDDIFGTNQPSYANGSRITTSNCYSGGCLNVQLGGIDANTITNISGGWRYSFSLTNSESGVSLSLRYRLIMPAVYDYDEYSRVQVSLDGKLIGRGSKSYVDHTGGDNNFAHDTGWVYVQLHLGDVGAGDHTLVIGGLSNKKNASTELTDIYIDTVALTSGNVAPAPSAAKVLVDRLDIAAFKADIQTLSNMGDRCRMSGCAPYNSYFNAQNWLAQQLASMGYTPQYNNYTTSLPSTTGSNLYVTKVGTTHPESMYIVSNMLDGRGGGGGADDDASGVALTLEIARLFASPDVQTDYSIRFIFFDEEEAGLNGSEGYVATRASLRGKENPVGSGLYPEPNWLGIIQHDMILYDHGVGTPTTNQSPYADLDVEWTAGATFATQSQALAQTWRFLNTSYATDYPANSANNSGNTDDYSFRNHCPAVSVRENRRLGPGEWINPYYHKTSDVYLNYSEADFLLGFNATQTTLGVIAELAGARLTTANQPPVANPQSVSTNEDTTLGITLTGSDPEGAPLTYLIVSQPSNGTLSGTAPALTYTPAPNFNGADNFTFKVNDGTTESAPATVSITVNPVNDAPVAFSQNLTTTSDSPLSMTLMGSDLDNDPLTYSVTAQPIYGSLQGSAPSLTYIPPIGFQGTDSFAFQVTDSQAQSLPASITISVTPVNHPPIAYPQSLATNEDLPLEIQLAGSDPDNNPINFRIISGPANGRLDGNAEFWTYTPNPDFFGPDSFTFVSTDGQFDSPIATVLIDVSPVSDAPLAINQALNLNEDVPITFTLTGTDGDGDALTFSMVSYPQHGELEGTPPQLTYYPAANYFGSDGLSFRVNDGLADSAEATITFEILSVNDLPIANPQTLATDEDTAISVELSGSDLESALLSYSVNTDQLHGSLSGTPPIVYYTPSADFNGLDTFSYTVNDGLDDSVPVIVSIQVNPLNDPPLANTLAVVTQQDQEILVNLTGSDVDADPLTCLIVTPPINGSLIGTGCNLAYKPASGYVGSDTFTFKVNDGQIDSLIAMVSITVNPSGPVFWDDFETNLGWIRNPNGSDTATLGVWERANPESVDYNGLKQLGTTMSGSFDLVTGPLAGSSAGAYDLDGGTTSMRSPLITLPLGRDLELSFSYYLAHSTNSSTADYLRISIVDATNHLVFEELGMTDDDDAVWATFEADITSFAGKNIYLLIEAGDVSTASLLEAGIDDVQILSVKPNTPPTAISQSIVTDEDLPIGVSLTGSDPDGDTLSYRIVSAPMYGTLSGTVPNLVYTPNANYAGNDTFSFVSNDGKLDSETVSVTILVNPVNDPPVANSQTDTTNQNTPLSIILTGSDVDSTTLSFSVVTQPANGILSGSAPNLTYTPKVGFSGADSFTFVVNDGAVNSTPVVVSITVNLPGPVTVFSDDFETNKGWVRNSAGTDTAKSGLWERANPKSTSYSGTKQMGTTTSGSYDLVTGPLAGSSSSSYDVDGGITTMRSPLITLPISGNLQLSFRYYLAHRSNSSSADYLRVKIVGNTTVTILQELGAANDDDAVWATFAGDLTSFSGQSVYILIEAADASSESLVEAAIDDVLITAN